MQIISLSLATLILIFAATLMPFLRVDVGGMRNSASILDTALAFSQGLLAILVIFTIAMILALPALRAALVIYVLAPLVFDRPAAPGARRAFRLAEYIRPWAMAEVFAIGCAVALVKITELAHVQFGVAFWMFATLVVLVVIQERFMCSWSVWNALNASNR